MTSISNNAYYSLANSSTGSGAKSSSSALAQLPSLASIMAQNESSASAGNSNSYYLDLSPGAQAYLNQQKSAASSNSAPSFTLSSAQQKSISSIVSKYADAPYTQDTYDAIQNDLKAVGLDADQLSAESQVKQFNRLGTLLDALNGTHNQQLASTTSTTDTQTKASNYMKEILNQWKTISTTANASPDTSTQS